MQRNASVIVILALAVAVTKTFSNTAPLVIEEQKGGALEATEASAGEPAAPTGARLLREYLGPDPESAVRLRFLIATLPHPELSSLDWAFDSHLDALRRAFEQAGFVLDRFELPWNAEPTDESEPGVLLFVNSSSAELALVFLVGELPTRGINRVAFDGALQQRADLLRTLPVEILEEDVLRILGPTFSGSCLSLRDILAQSDDLLEVRSIEVVSGAATSASNRSSIEGEDGRVAQRAIRFSTTLHTDDALLAVLEHELLPRLGLELSDVAVLKESSTSYGNALPSGETEGDADTDPAVERMLVIPFPMSLHSLRQAYDSQGQRVESDFKLPGRKAATNIPLDLEDRRAEGLHATSVLTPPTIELLLEEMTRVLERDRIRAALLFATDVRDKLFLGAELKKRLPDLQLFTTEGNVLYLWPTLNPWLRGMVVLGSYPTMIGGAHSPTPSRQEFLFANEGAAGVFNATLLQLGRPELVHDYTFEADAGPVKRPPVRVTTVGAGTMLPVALYSPSLPPESRAPLVIEKAPPPAKRGEEPVGLGIVALFGYSCVLSSLLWASRRREPWLTAVLAGNVETELEGGQRHLRSVALQHELCVICQLVALWSILLPNAILLGWLALSGQREIVVSAAFALGTAVYGCGVIVARTWKSLPDWRKLGLGTIDFGRELLEPDASQRRKWKLELVLRSVIVTAGLAYFLLTLFSSVRIAEMLFDGDPNNLEQFFRRSIELDQAVSFLLPTGLIGFVLALWCGWQRWRLRSLVRSAPIESVLDRWLPGGTPTARMRRRIFRFLPGGLPLPAIVAVFMILLWMIWRIERPLDDLVLGGTGAVSSPFDWILRLGLVFTLASSAWAIVRLRTLWKAFEVFLDALAKTPALLPSERQREAFGQLVHQSFLPSSLDADLRRHARESWSELLGARGLPFDATEELRRTCLGRADEREAPDPVLVRALTALDPPAVVEDGDALAAKVADVQLTETMLYIDWVLEHCRRLAWFLIGATLLTTALVWSYPLQPQSLIQNASLLVFVAALACLAWFAASMNRNPTLSRIVGTTPGELDWNKSLVTNLVLFVFVPLVTLLTSQSPELRQILMDGIRPILAGLTAG